MEDCGALRLTPGDEEADEHYDCTCTCRGEQDVEDLEDLEDQVCSTAAGSDIPVKRSSGQTNSSKTAPSSLFDADFDMTLDPQTGRWLISNVNVLKR